jgi:DNA-directed RNA polymerase specialized sigma24 family protein
MQTENLILQYSVSSGAKFHSLINHKSLWRRKKILELASKGLTQAQTAREIGCSYSTVKREIYEIRKTCRIKERSI